jgi:hypothetical protein
MIDCACALVNSFPLFWPSGKLFDPAILIAPSIMHAWNTGVVGDEDVFADGVDHETTRPEADGRLSSSWRWAGVR